MRLEDARAEEALKDAARAREHAYGPYSGFRIGSAVATDRNAVVPGSLVENASPGLAMRSERAAFCSVVSKGLGPPEILALVSPRTAGNLTWPCDACLQVALELGGPDFLVVVADGGSDVAQARRLDLAARLPFKGPR